MGNDEEWSASLRKGREKADDKKTRLVVVSTCRRGGTKEGKYRSSNMAYMDSPSRVSQKGGCKMHAFEQTVRRELNWNGRYVKTRRDLG